MNIAVAGSNGFVGKHLIKVLNDTQYNDIRIDIENGIDLSDNSILNSDIKFDVMVHLANLSFVPASYKNPELFYRTNILTTLNALELCRKNNARLIYLSSYVYGTPQYLPIDENHPVCSFNPYAQTKCICEDMCKAYYRDFGVNTIIFRPFNIYGEGQSGMMLIPEILSQLKEGKKTIQLKDPNPRRDYVNVQDVVRAIKCAVDKDEYSGCEAYNISSGISYSVKEITEIINRNLKESICFSFGDSDRPNEVNETLGSYDKIKNDLGWKPTIDFEVGIKNIIK